MAAILRVGLAIGFDGQGLVALTLPLYARLIGFMCFRVGRFAGPRRSGLACAARLKPPSSGQDKKCKGELALTDMAHRRIPTASFDLRC